MKILLLNTLLLSVLFANNSNTDVGVLSYNHLIFLLFVGIVLGLILMAAIYNAVLYYYHRDKSFLYYALMQIGMIHILFYDTNIITTLIPTQNDESLFYTFISLFTLFFILMFTRVFLDTATSLPKQDKVLKYILIFILIDAIIYPVSIIFEFGLYLVILIYVVYLGYRRMRQHYEPAFFFFIGWSIFVLTILIDGFVDFELHIEPYAFNPMFLGTMVEAIVLAIALAFQFKELRTEQEQQKQLLIHQSKLASMGEMLGNIAHQWRQPLTRLSYTLMNIEVTEDIKEKKELVEESTKQLEFMSQTINDFTNFYAPSKEKELFSLEHVAKEVLALVHYEEIEIELEIKEDTSIHNYKNEFKQVLLNLLSNAKDVLITRKITNPSITIVVESHKINIQDNAGGVALEDIEKIFEPYFSTKEDGLGIGLYMSKMIIEKNMGGTLKVSNTDNGAIFSLFL